MSNQESMFYPQDYTPQEQAARNTASREQVEEQRRQPIAEGPPTLYREAPYQDGYATRERPSQERYAEPPPEGQMEGEKIRPQAMRKRRGKGFWLAIIIILLLVGGLGSFKGTNSSASLQPRTFLVSGRANIKVNNSLGSVRIHTGNTDRVVINAQEHVSGLMGKAGNIPINTTPNGNTIDIQVQSQNAGFTFPGSQESVDLDIVVPTTSDIQIEDNAGAITIDGVNGQIDAKTNLGSVRVEHAQLSGQSTLKSNAGSVSFQGSLDPNGNYDFSTNAGGVEATLPADSSFSLNAGTDMGSVHNDFGSNIVGNAPHAQLNMHSNAGSIKLKRGA